MSNKNISSIKIAIACSDDQDLVGDYLSNNYKVIGKEIDTEHCIIAGFDDHGWSMDAYIIPRLGSAMIHVREITSEVECSYDTPANVASKSK